MLSGPHPPPETKPILALAPLLHLIVELHPALPPTDISLTHMDHIPRIITHVSLDYPATKQRKEKGYQCRPGHVVHIGLPKLLPTRGAELQALEAEHVWQQAVGLGSVDDAEYGAREVSVNGTVDQGVAEMSFTVGGRVQIDGSSH